MNNDERDSIPSRPNEFLARLNCREFKFLRGDNAKKNDEIALSFINWKSKFNCKQFRFVS